MATGRPLIDLTLSQMNTWLEILLRFKETFENEHWKKLIKSLLQLIDLTFDEKRYDTAQRPLLISKKQGKIQNPGSLFPSRCNFWHQSVFLFPPQSSPTVSLENTGNSTVCFTSSSIAFLLHLLLAFKV